ncbi:hypothetical protein PV326_008581, partial [Microctonus aethiopoides]
MKRINRGCESPVTVIADTKGPADVVVVEVCSSSSGNCRTVVFKCSNPVCKPMTSALPQVFLMLRFD